MNHCAIQQNGVVRSGEDMGSYFAVAAYPTMFMPDHRPHHRREPVVCPRPRRAGVVAGTVHDRPLRWQLSQAEISDSRAGSELLDIILAKGGHGSGTNNTTTQVGSSPPFFSGSPPSRVSNPLIQDARFLEERPSPAAATGCPQPPSPAPSFGMSGSPTSSMGRKGGCVRANFGNNPVVRIEGFNCLDRDRSRNCSIPTLA